MWTFTAPVPHAASWHRRSNVRGRAAPGAIDVGPNEPCRGNPSAATIAKKILQWYNLDRVSDQPTTSHSPQERNVNMKFHLEIEREDDGRWIAEIPELPGVMAYGVTKKEAINSTLTLALRVLAEKLEQGE